MSMLANDPADLHASQWSPTNPLRLPWTWGISPNCKIQINAVSPRSSDVFQQVMIAQRAALVVNSCVNNKGGTVSLGPGKQFQIRVFGVGFGDQATA